LATLFISDLHLHPSRPAIITCFLEFMVDQQGKAEALYILGDLFEAWIGDDHPESAYQPVKSALRACADAGTPVYLMYGNRDFMIGKQFSNETGCTLLTDPTRIDLYGRPTLLMHGDTLCTDDLEYQALRSKVRDPAWQQQVIRLPADERLMLAQQARSLSALSTQHKDEYIMDANQDEVLRVAEQYQVALIIHGHTHRPGIHSFKAGNRAITRIVLGDWYESGNVLIVDDQGWQFRTITPE